MFARLLLSIVIALFALAGTVCIILFASVHLWGSAQDDVDRFPRALRDMHVGDDGAFACTARLADHSLRLLLVGADGATRFDSKLAYETDEVDGPSYPHSLGVIVDQGHDRVLFRVAHEDGGVEEEWRVVRWSTGDLISSVRPTPPYDRSQAYCLLGLVKSIEGTPLLACHWTAISWNDSPRGAARGARFVVSDFDAKTIWELDLPHDYEAGGVKREADRVWGWARRSDAVLTCSAPNRFGIVLAADAQRVTFEVQGDVTAAAGWAVRGVAREPYSIDFEPQDR